MSLVEATIILLVLMLLTGVMAPSIFDYVHDGQMVKVKEDCEAIGTAVARLTRDVGPCLQFAYSAGGCTKDNRVEILYSLGEAATGKVAGTASAFTAATDSAMTALNWDKDRTTNFGDSMENQFVLNAPVYFTPASTSPTGYTLTGPFFGLGWRGAYIAPPVGPDPWGGEYLVNSGFLSVASDAAAGTAEGAASGGWSRDVICLSAGVNRMYETPIGGDAHYGTVKTGDDFVFVIHGDTR